MTSSGLPTVAHSIFAVVEYAMNEDNLHSFKFGDFRYFGISYFIRKTFTSIIIRVI